MVRTYFGQVNNDVLFSFIQNWVKSKIIGNFITFYIMRDSDTFSQRIIFQLKEDSNIRTELKIEDKEVYENRDNLYIYLDTMLMDVLVNWMF